MLVHRIRAQSIAQLAGFCTFLFALACTADSGAYTMHIEGRGAPTVIFEAGLGDTYETWSHVQSRIATDCARTLSYDRAGYPRSPPAIGSRDAEHIVQELRAQLQASGIDPPYVLVGHSLGGLYMQYFARQHPEEVAGLVLVDSTHWNQQLMLNARQASSYTGRGVTLLFMAWIARRELADSTRAGEQVHASPLVERLPAIVLSSTQPIRGETPTLRMAAARLQEEIAADFPAAHHIRVERSGHYIHRDRPDVVIDAVRELAGCTPLARAPD